MQNSPGSASAPAPSVRWNALRLLADGKLLIEVSRELHLPFSTVQKWSVKFDREITRISNNKLRNREAFHQVVARYNDIRSIMGNPGAVDYAHITGGSGPKYAPDKGTGFQMIDYTVDVDNVVKAVLTEGEQEFWHTKVKTEDYDLTNQSEAFLSLQEFLGHEFITRGLYPVAEYFGGRKDD